MRPFGTWLSIRPTALLLLLLCGASAGSAQLDDTCTVSALNRTAPVDGSGVWVLTNVPVGSGLVRVRATCVAGGLTRSGQSSLVTVPASGTLTVGDISFAQAVPIPSQLTLAAPQTTLSAAGQALQLTAAATYPDGSQADVTPAATGTGYRSSNPAIAAVDPNGLVTAHLSGVVMISALNEGALGVLRLQVVLSGSSVGDGIPDDWKIAHGLDPNDPYVAMEDPDHDGLTNLEEYQYGTDPQNPDTDGDGLSDGDEVHVYHTNPLLWDTDGDGFSDGVEVQTGSDPLDIHSFNLARALASITLDPAAFTLVFNTVYGEASRQLHGTGNVIDGRTIDLFRPLYGVGLTSSDLTIANFGSDPGRVFAGQSGTATVTANAGGHLATSTVTVRTFPPQPTSLVYIPGSANGVDVAGTYAYVAAGVGGLQVVDVSDLFAPFVAAALNLPGNANWVRVAGGLAYLTVGDAGLAIVDVHDPLHPALVSQLPLAGTALNLAVRPGLVYVVLGTAGLEIVDVSQPAHPVPVGLLPLPGEARGVDVSGTLAVVAALTAGVHVVDVSNPARPALLGTAPTRLDEPSAANDVVAREHWAYVADGGGLVLGGLKTIDFSDPANPVLAGATGDLFGLNSLALDGSLALAADYYFYNAVPIFDVGGVPPAYVTQLDFRGFSDFNAFAIALSGGAAFVAANKVQLTGKGTSDLGMLEIGLYRVTEQQAAGPTVAITAPAAGATVLERAVVPVTVDAHDDAHLQSVAVLRDGQLLATLYRAPFTTSFTVPVGATSFTLQAVATDFFGFQTTAQETLAVAPNLAPVVRLLSPTPALQLTEGGSVTLAAEASGAQPVQYVTFTVNGQSLSALPPFRFDYRIPLGTTQLTVTAVAVDAFGAGAPAGPVVVPVAKDNPPTATVVAPADGTSAVEGSPLTIVGGATDDIQVAFVFIYVNGAVAGTFTSSPYQLATTMPAAGQDLTIQVVATDHIGQQTTSPTVTVHSLPDPLTTVVGTVVDRGGAPVGGAAVTVTHAGLALASGTTAADGTFSIPAVPTLSGYLAVLASATVDGCPAQGGTPPLIPVQGGKTAAGTVTLDTRQLTTASGLVVGPDGQPLAGATVTVASGDLADLATVLSGPGGVFVAAGLPARQWPLVAIAQATVSGVTVTGRGSTFVPAAGGRTDLGTVALQPLPAGGPDPLTTVTGLVVASDGTTPVGGASVVVDAGPYGLLTATTGADGRFSLPGVPTVQGSILVAASQRQSCTLFNSGQPHSVSPLAPGQATDVGTLVLAPDTGPGGIFFSWRPLLSCLAG